MSLVLDIQNLSVSINSPAGIKFLVRQANLSVEQKSIVGLVGGSGSGKTTTALAVLGLLEPGLNVAGGRILLEGKDLLKLPEEELRLVRGSEVGMIFQEPLNAFNPVFTIGYQIEEVLKYHLQLNAAQRRQRVMELLETVGIRDPQRVAREYPHRLSGGLRQRAMIAQAIAASPKLLIADEPTSNLDVTLQAMIMELFQSLTEKLNVSMLLITHDLGVVSHLTQKMAVMREGQIVESGKTKDILASPKEEYTKQLLMALEV